MNPLETTGKTLEMEVETTPGLDTDKKFCSIVLDVMEKHGVSDIVCSPGSRNTPLIIAAAARDSIRKHVVVDERSAAFVALGMTLVGRQPVALLCTSGTALLNYAPAVAEAFYQHLPLIVVSADRPQQWIDQDDSQTLRQFEALANFVKKSYELPAYGDNDPELQWYANRIANDAMIEACGGRKGPVHINVRLSEPLGGKARKNEIPERVINILEADSIGNKEVVKQLAEEVAVSKVMLVAGFMQPDSRLQKAVADFSRHPNVTVMAETLSNLHLDKEYFSVDSVITGVSEEKLDSYAPDLIISIGGSLVSRKLKEYLRRNSDKCRHWSLGKSFTTSDCFKSISLRIEVEPTRFLKNINARLWNMNFSGDVNTYAKEWSELRGEVKVKKEEYMRGVEWSELKAFDIILKTIPPSYNLFLSNGTAVRYAQIIDYKLPHASYCNRGVSGIDGSCSTAIGGAITYKGNTILITGDLSMAYDIGSLSLQEIPSTMKIIVIDNQGGGIFRFIPTTSGLEEREEYFCVGQKLPLQHLAEGYGWHYIEATDEDSLLTGLKELFYSNQKTIMKVVCNGEKSAEILKGYMRI